MNLVNKKVTHEIFGVGNVITYNDSVIKINFKSGEKKFVFPDAFGKYIAFVDKKATEIVNKKLEAKEEERKKEELILKEKRAIEQRRRYIESQKRLAKDGDAKSKAQSVFWCKEGEEDEIFTEWKVFTGKFKSGKRKGQPRKLARMSRNSACLITRRTDDMLEEDRQILGAFMANELFDGRRCEDGYITSHPEYRIQLSEEESEKMLFWNYYTNTASSSRIVWNSGRQRYFDNIWMAQILKDIINLREGSEDQKDAQAFLEYFCKVNLINQNELPDANGALMQLD
ncbi:MAG: malate synthase [Clostridiales bacterium]|nr:malate synthase [Clostridiales bacterium]